MNKLFTSIPIVIILGVIIIAISIYADWGKDSYSWFQRSGSLIVLLGAILSYRSILRLGVKGVGGASTGVKVGKVKGSFLDENGRRMVQVEQNPKDIEHSRQLLKDKYAGYIGAIFIVFGTIIWGYGDLVAKI